MGPTASGKTATALALATSIPLEVISVDSALVYRGLDIGTAKPGPAEQRQVRHHLVDICDPTERYSAAQFCSDARQLIEQIQARGRMPLLVGGTGLYFRALEQGIADLPDADEHIRQQLQARLATEGAASLHAELRRTDPVAASRIHQNDPQRLIRALEVITLTGQAMSQLWRSHGTAPYAGKILKFALNQIDRAELHRRIELRFDRMLAAGFINEVARLRRQPGMTADLSSMRAVGYRAVWQHLDGAIGVEQMREQGIAATRQLAKRQLTWLRRETNLVSLGSSGQAAAQTMIEQIKQLNISIHA